ncbi:hypothetical protein SAMN05421866_4184 [Chryseobacterium oranimense]|uniref:Uncharacterized protein n=1 Tax=Chryseobacterium oranimense TaxID=421058 RepID=A0A1M5WRP3_9FLAO|nr:hypothetical protein [Chryseobacterium oranimense]SHH89774.1 hypothetical protein SAMN05421866_4184 [Chryseobacterium oranimense]
MLEEIKSEEIKIKVSICNMCKGWVRSAKWHKLNKKERNAFYREVSKYELDINTLTFTEAKEFNTPMCECT